MAKLSIVVPVYGVENYLEKCVDSLRKQTLEDIEIILVDDGSKDRCPEMCDDFAKKDSRIKVIHKLNGGISDARNVGVQAATTPYIIFIDSDDEAKPTMCEVLYRHITDKDVDIVTALVDEVKDGQIVGDQSSFEERRISGEEALFDLLSGNGITMYAYSKIYKKHLLDDIKYPKGKIYEDAFTTPYLIASCRQVYVISDRLVNYVRRNDSITLSKFSLKDFHCIEAHQKNLDFVREKYPKYEQAAMFRYCWSLLYVYDKILVHQQESLQEAKQLFSEIKKQKRNIFNNPYISLKRKIALVVLLTSKKIYRHILLRNG